MNRLLKYLRFGKVWVIDKRDIIILELIYINKVKDIPFKQLEHDIEQGFITLNEEQSPVYSQVSWGYSGRVLVIHRLTVDPEHQGKKLASQLMDFAEQEAAAGGYYSIRLDAFAQNPAAIVLYEHRRFRKAGKVRFRKGLFFCYEKSINPF